MLDKPPDARVLELEVTGVADATADARGLRDSFGTGYSRRAFATYRANFSPYACRKSARVRCRGAIAIELGICR